MFEAICAAVAEEHELAIACIHLVRPGAVPKTPSGKIQRRLCREMVSQGELTIVATWQRGEACDSRTGNGRHKQTALANQTHPPAGAIAKQPTEGMCVGEVQGWLRNRIAERLECKPSLIDIYQSLATYGLTSRDAVEMSAELEVRFQRTLSPTLLYDYPTIERLAGFLAGGTCVEEQAAVQDQSRRDDEPIAIVGIGCRFPGASSPDEFWRLLVEGTDAISDVPADRWNRLGRRPPSANGNGLASNGNGFAKNVLRGGWLHDVDRFDSAFFGISPREAKLIDPQQRLLLEVAWETIEDLGLPPATLRGSRTGVFVGSATNDYRQRVYGRTDELDPYWCTGNASSIAANRLSYVMDLRGPSMAIDTACSSSLVSVHLACRSLQMGECDLALAGGVNLILSPDVSLSFARAGGLASDGRCKAFDAQADGIVRSEGVGLVALKRLSEAEANGDIIYAVLRGSAVNQDGHSNGITAPRQAAQTAVIKEAWRNAKRELSDASYVETHGAGTLLGDVIEAHALVEAFRSSRDRKAPCAIGSVKTNIGHCEAAAGIAGLIKVALAMRNGQLPGNLHFYEPNPSIRFDEMPFYIPKQTTPWPANSGKRLAGVSSFGFGGANAHIVLESFDRQCDMDSEPMSVLPTCILPLSAARVEDIPAVAQKTRDLAARDDIPSANLCIAAATRRESFRHRAGVVFRDRSELLEQLDGLISGNPCLGTTLAAACDRHVLPISFVFSGYGGQWHGMHRELMARVAAFRAKMCQCDAIARGYTGWSILESLGEEGTGTETTSQDLEVVHTCLFAFQVSLAAALEFFGVTPTAITGHSMGEVAAAHVAGALSLEDAVRVIVERSRALKRALETTEDHGAMAALRISAEEAEDLIRGLGGHMTVSVSNSPKYTVLAGPRPMLQTLIGDLRRRRIGGRIMNVPGAAHTPALEPYAAALQSKLGGLEPRQTEVPFYSTQHACELDGLTLDANYWAASIHRPVLFAPIVDALLGERVRDFVEIGPSPILTAAIAQCALGAQTEVSALPAHARDDHDLRVLATALSSLHCRGAKLNWSRLYHGDATSVRLPTYPWRRERYWLEESARVVRTPDDVAAAPVASGECSDASSVVSDETVGDDSSPSSSNRSDDREESERDPHQASPADTGSGRDGALIDITPEQIRAMLGDEREAALRTYLGEQIARTLDLNTTAVNVDEPLTHLGIDSLMAMEIKNRVERELSVTISIARFLEGPTISGLTAMLLPQLAQQPPDAESSPPDHEEIEFAKTFAEFECTSEEEAATLLEKLDELTDDEVAELMRRMVLKEGGNE